MKVAFHRLAVREVHAAEAWYADRSAPVAERFRIAVEMAINRLAEGIGTHSIGDTRYRYIRVPRFPYRLIFFIDTSNTARVVAVSHDRRRPMYWRRRQ